jgi:hypothetical protein
MMARPITSVMSLTTCCSGDGPRTLPQQHHVLEKVNHLPLDAFALQRLPAGQEPSPRPRSAQIPPELRPLPGYRWHLQAASVTTARRSDSRHAGPRANPVVLSDALSRPVGFAWLASCWRSSVL